MANLFAIPNFIKASSPQGLRRLMLSLQSRDAMEYRWYDIQFVNGSWYAWYLQTPKSQTDKIKVVNDVNTNPEKG